MPKAGWAYFDVFLPLGTVSRSSSRGPGLRQDVVVLAVRQAEAEFVDFHVHQGGKAGVSRIGVTMAEGNRRNPTMVFCHALAEAMGLHLSDIVKKVEQEI